MAILPLGPSPSGRVAVVRSGGTYHVVATAAIPAGTVVLRLEGELAADPDRYSLQVAADRHLRVPPGTGLELLLDRFPWRFLNHGCAPTCRVDGLDLVARRRIRAWEELTFDYDSTEFDLAEPFPCHCGAQACRGRVRGYRHLDDRQRRRLGALASPWLRDLAGTGTAAEEPA